MHPFQIHTNVRIPVRDGITLSANLWLPIALTPTRNFRPFWK